MNVECVSSIESGEFVKHETNTTIEITELYIVVGVIVFYDVCGLLRFNINDTLRIET